MNEGTYEQLEYINYGDHIEIAKCDYTATEVVIPAEIDGVPVTGIGGWGISECSNLTSITIPDSVTSIGKHAFNNCSSLTEITIPDSITSIGKFAFNNCSSLTDIAIPDSVTSIGSWAFHGCSSLTNITIPDSVASIGERAFEGCSSLKSIAILNPECEIYYSKYTIYAGTEIKGYDNSTAQAYAEKYGREFVSLGKARKTTDGNAIVRLLSRLLPGAN